MHTNSLPPTSRIVIQGVEGSFHEIAARQLFGEAIQIVPTMQFSALFQMASDAQLSEAAVLAIENSIAGSILGNYRLMEQYDLTIIAEVYLRIEQNLLALPGVSLQAIEEVHSHPMAIAQCEAFLDQYPHIRRVETADTAESAAEIARKGHRNQAAIASILAGKTYGLELLAEGIETNKVNYTRFLAVQRSEAAEPVLRANKVSVRFELPHQQGSLSRVLTMLAAQSANITKIQSVPLRGQLGEYRFFLDFTQDNPTVIPETLRLLDVFTDTCKILGVYKKWQPASQFKNTIQTLL